MVLEVLGYDQLHVGSVCVALLVLELHPKVERLLGLGVYGIDQIEVCASPPKVYDRRTNLSP